MKKRTTLYVVKTEEILKLVCVGILRKITIVDNLEYRRHVRREKLNTKPQTKHNQSPPVVLKTSLCLRLISVFGKICFTFSDFFFVFLCLRFPRNM